MSITHPHDKLFKASMSNLKVAREFFQSHLPENLQSELDFNSLELQPGSYIDKDLQLYASDVLYKIKLLETSESAYLYILAEHQSSVDNLMPFRLWQYTLSIWQEHLKKNKSQKLPLVIPLVFYNGEVKYNGPRSLQELIEAPEQLINQFLLTPFQLIDTHNIEDQSLRERYWSGLMELVMKHAYEKEALNFIQLLLELLNRVLQEEKDTDYALSVLKYFINQAETAEPDKLINTLKTGLTESKEDKIMATLANYFAEQGKQKWLEEGIQQGESKLLLRLLQKKFPNVPSVYLEKIHSANSDDLLKWTDRIVEYSSLEKIFED